MRFVMPLILVAGLVGFPGPSRGDELNEVGDSALKLRSAVAVLLNEFERFEESLARSITKEQTPLFQQADELFGDLLAFERQLPKADKKKLAAEHDRLTLRLRALVKSAMNFAPADSALDRTGAYLLAANDGVAEQLEFGQPASATLKRRIERQAHAQSEASSQLRNVVVIAVGGKPGRDVLIADVKGFDKEVETFLKQAERGADPATLAAALTRVDQAWQRVTTGVKLLPPRENYLLIRSATRLDAIQGRLFMILEMPQKRTPLLINT